MERPFFPITKAEAKRQGIQYSSEANRNSGFPTRLRELRNAVGVSQETLSKEIGISKSTLGLYETGDTLPDAETVRKMALFFEVSADYLLGLSDFKSNETAMFTLESLNFTEKAAENIHRISDCKYLKKRMNINQSAMDNNIVRFAEQHDMLVKLLEEDAFFVFLTNAVAYVQLETPNKLDRVKIEVSKKVSKEDSVVDILDIPSDLILDVAKKHTAQVIEDLLEQIRIENASK